jgi:hypothetical protein
MTKKRSTTAGYRPVCNLTQWMLYEVVTPFGTSRHSVGVRTCDEETQISGDLVRFDANEMRAHTGDGLTHQLLGPPGLSEEVRASWNLWCSWAGATSVTEITPYTWA